MKNLIPSTLTIHHKFDLKVRNYTSDFFQLRNILMAFKTSTKERHMDIEIIFIENTNTKNKKMYVCLYMLANYGVTCIYIPDNRLFSESFTVSGTSDEDPKFFPWIRRS